MAEPVSQFGGIPVVAAVSQFGGVPAIAPAVAPARPPTSVEIGRQVRARAAATGVTPHAQAGMDYVGMPPMGPGIPYGGGSDPPNPPHISAALANDISIDGAPAAVRAMAGYGYGSKEEIYRAGLTRYYGKPVEVRTGPQTGEVEFLNPETGAWTLAQGAGVLGDIASLPADVAVAGMGALGAAGGAVIGAPGGPVGMGVGGTVGEMVGTYMAEYQRLLTGKQMGVVPATMTPDEMALAAANTAAWTGTTSVMGAAAWRVIKGIMGRGIPDIPAEEFAQRAQALRERTAALGPGVQSTLRPEQVMAGTSIGDTLNAAVRGASLRANPVRDVMRDQAEAGVGALMRRMPAAVTSPTMAQDVGGALQNAILQQRGVYDLPLTTPREAGAAARAAAVRAEEAASLRAEQVYAPLRAQTATIPVTPTAYLDVADELQAVLDSSTFKGLAQEDQRLINNMLALRQPMKDAEGNIVEGEFDVPPITFEQTQRDLSAIRRAIRSFSGNPEYTGDIAVLQDIQQGIMRARIQALEDAGKPELARQIANADIMYKQMRDFYDRSIIGQIRQDRRGVYVMPDEQVFEGIFANGNLAEAEDVAALLGQATFADRMKWQEAVLNMWRQKVLDPAGIPDPMKAQAFDRDYGAAARLFLSPSQQARLSNPVAFATDTLSVRQGLENLQAALTHASDGAILSGDPSEVFAKTWTGEQNAPGYLRRVVNLLQEYSPGRLDEYRQLVGDDLVKAVVEDSGGLTTVNSSSLNAYIAANENRLREVFGSEYVGGLKEIADGFTALNVPSMPAAITTASGGQSTAVGVLRDILGRLSRHQRIFNAYNRIQNAEAGSILIRAIQDPNVMEQLLRLRTISPGSRMAARILGGLGGYSLVEGGDVGQLPGVGSLAVPLGPETEQFMQDYSPAHMMLEYP